MRWLIGLLVLSASLLGTLASLSLVVDQDHLLRTCLPVQATVTSSFLETHSGKHTSYSPKIQYEYVVGQAKYASSHIHTFDDDGSRSWAQGILNRFPLGPAVAYFDPQSPGDSILLKGYAIDPYLLTALCVGVSLITLAFLFRMIGGKRYLMTAVPVGADGWMLVLPQVSLRRSVRIAAFYCCAITFTFVPLFAHFAYVAEHYGVGWMALVCLPVLWVISLITWIRRWLVSRDVSDARVEIQPAPMQLGSPLEIRVELDAYRRLRVKGMTAHVVCTEYYKEKRNNKTIFGNREKGKKAIVLIANDSKTITQANEVVRGEGQVLFEADQWSKSWEGGVKVYPYYTWEVRVELSLIGMVDYKAAFPIGAV